ncbi:MAG TPA: hypothetical protein VFS60_00190 [Thermoanaerobaculia bacterium]|nr:hypothetical protein [Thermoanaerobaculia bacterium]
MRHRVLGVCFAALLVVPTVMTAQQRSAAECWAAGNTNQREPAWWPAACGYLIPDSVRNAPPGAPNTLGDPAFHVDLRSTPDRLMTFALPNANTATLVANTLSQPFFGLEHDNTTGIMYAVDNGAAGVGPKVLGTLNKTTAAFTPIVTITGIPAADNVTGLAFQTSFAAGPIYVSAGDGVTTTLYTINTGTGAATAVGPTGTALMIDIAINSAGQMYGMDIGTDSLYTINTGTGAATLIGAIGFNANFAQGMDFDKTTGVLYSWLYLGAGVNHFVQYNLGTGAATIINSPTNIEAEGALTPVSLQEISVE